MQGGDHEGEAAQSVVQSEHGQGEQAPSRLRVLLWGKELPAAPSFQMNVNLLTTILTFSLLVRLTDEHPGPDR